MFSNVQEHSAACTVGFAGLQFYQRTNHIQTVVSDSGLGIVGTLAPILAERYPEVARRISASSLDPGVALLEEVFSGGGISQVEDNGRGLGLKRSGPMRNGIVSHHCRITPDNLFLLDDLDFVFVAVDSGPSRRLICEYLQSAGIPFIDVGMDLQINQDAIGLHGMFRVTLSTPQQHKHFFDSVPTFDDQGEDLYRSNIQVADMNMCNAAHAVICWKQYRCFYMEHKRSHHRVYTVFDQRLHLSVTTEKDVA